VFLCCPQALALEFGERADASHDGTQADSAAAAADSTFYEITIATVDQPKLLSRLSDAMVRALEFRSSWQLTGQQLPQMCSPDCMLLTH
jgi:hypothetical protein